MIRARTTDPLLTHLISECSTRMSRHHLTALSIALFTLPACAGSPPPETPPTPPVPVPATAPEVPVGARATARAPSRESAPYTRVKVVFDNPSARPCTFSGYTLRWGQGLKKTLSMEPFTIPAGETRERWVKMDPSDAGYDELEKADIAALAVTVKSDCPVQKPDR